MNLCVYFNYLFVVVSSHIFHIYYNDKKLSNIIKQFELVNNQRMGKTRVVALHF